MREQRFRINYFCPHENVILGYHGGRTNDVNRNPNFPGDGSPSNYLNVGVVTGGVTVTMRLGTGSLDMFIKPNRIRFDDNQWHKISVTRKVQGVRNAERFSYNF